MTETLGQRIKAARKGAGMTQEALANAVHVSRQSVSLWENDKTEPDIETLRLVAECLNTNLSALLDEAPAPAAETPEVPAETAPEQKPDEPAARGGKAKRKQIAFLALCLCVILACGVFTIVRLAAPKQETYDPAWFQEETPVVPGQANILMYTHETPIAAWQRAQNAKPDWIFHLYFREQNGVGFTFESANFIYFGTRQPYHTQPLGAEMFAASTGSTYIGPYQTRQIYMGKTATDFEYAIGCVLHGTDDNGNQLTFRAWLPLENNIE